MEREPRTYGRLLVVAGMALLLVLDVTGVLPYFAFVGVGVAVILGAAGVHAVGGERRAAAGWVFIGVALGVFGVAAVPENVVALAVVAVLFVGGLALQVNQRLEERT